MSRLVRDLYKIARTVNTLEKITSGNPKRIKRHAKNILIGKVLRKSGFWSFLWK